MIANLMALSVRSRWMIIALTLIVSAYGVFQLTRLPIDAVPDITNKQVQINTLDASLSPVEIEKRVTFPVETAL
ncbi:MAG TPA: efflux RND transporter permease subunit, partial [Caulobacter sp.]|nr:efflux RND transporter permease subunit [Caulobacter sp.]